VLGLSRGQRENLRRLGPPSWAALCVGTGWRKERDPPEVVDDGSRAFPHNDDALACTHREVRRAINAVAALRVPAGRRVRGMACVPVRGGRHAETAGSEADQPGWQCWVCVASATGGLHWCGCRTGDRRKEVGRILYVSEEERW